MDTCSIIVLLSSFLVFGSMNTILTKVQFTISSVGLDGQSHLFARPWFQTFNMMLAMGYVLAHKCCHTAQARDASPVLNEAGISHTRKVAMVSVPAFFDILATVLGSAGMLYIPASLWQMLRGSSLVFAALFSIAFLKQKMMAFNWTGLLLCVVGICIVGTANLLDAGDKGDDDSHDASDQIIGISLVIAGQVVQAGQVIAEEFIMKGCDLPPFDIVGWEGLWGVLQMVVAVYPIVWALGVEDPIDTLVMVGNNFNLLLVVLLFQFSCATFNMTGISITCHLSAVHRMMLDASRTMVVWGFGLMMHSINPACPYGEKWTKYSLLQLGGFCVLVLGQATYGQVFRWKCFTYPSSEPEPLSISPTPRSTKIQASPASLQMGAAMMALQAKDAFGHDERGQNISMIRTDA